MLTNPLEAKAGSNRGIDSAQTATERTLADIWRETLGHADFGRDDDFFDIGGDSLQAMAFLVASEERFGVRVPLETLIIKGATIGTLAAKIDALRTRGADDTPVALNRSCPNAPLYAMHVVGGHLSDYLEIAARFNGVRPIIGLGARGLDSRLLADSTVAEIAAHGVAVLQKDNPQHPCCLIGFSSGGVYAFEMARLLIEQGQPEPALILLDCSCPWLDGLRWVRSTFRALKKGDVGGGGGRFVRGLSASIGKPMKPGSIDEAHLQAVLNYSPQAVTLRSAILFAGRDGQAGPKEQAEWRRLIGQSLSIETVPGNHMSMIRAPNVGRLADRIETWLQASRHD